MMRLARLSLILSAALGLTSCSETPRTQVMVFVRADDAVIARAERLEVIVRGGPPGSMLEERERIEYSGPTVPDGFPLSWPVRIAVVPNAGDVDRVYEVTATVFDDEGQVAQLRVRSGFVRQETLALELFLRASCVDVSCGGPETCREGQCTPVQVLNPCTLDIFESGGQKPSSGECAGFDAGVDAGPVDLALDLDIGPDEGPDEAVDAGTDEAVDVALDDAVDVSVDVSVDMAPVNPLERHNVVFVTSVGHVPGDLGGIAGANEICNEHAENADLPGVGSYVALLAEAASSPFDRLTVTGARGWVRLDGMPVADTVRDLVRGRLYYPISLTETGSPAPVAEVITGLTEELDSDPNTCSDWTRRGTPVANFGGAGTVGSGAERWAGSSIIRPCDEPRRLYCFATSRDAALDPPPAPPVEAALAFVSSTVIPANQGRGAFDRQCQSDAERGGFSGRFVALVSTREESAFDRIQFGVEFYRVDGVRLGTRDDVGDETVEASVSVTSTFEYGNFGVWTGHRGTPRDTGTEDCSVWSDTMFNGGFSLSAARELFRATTRSCATAQRVLCFQADDT
ncbi:MAG: hypothetical protein AAF938_27365 [Myxococcota bacterium]